MTRILVTGGHGAVGRAVVAAAAELGIETVTHSGTADGDLTDAATALDLVKRSRPDAIINAAGASYGDPATLWRTNLLIPLRLLDATRRAAPGALMVLVGSAAEYGLSEPGVLIREDHPCAPNSVYGQTKHAAGQAALAFGGPPVVVARLFNVVTSPHDPRSLLGRLASDYAAGTVDPPGAEAIRDFVPIAGVARALVTLCGAPGPPPIVNVCTGVARTAAEALGRTSSRRDGSWAVGDPALLRAATGLQLTPAPPRAA